MNQEIELAKSLEKMKGHKFEAPIYDQKVSYKEAILYALGIGFGKNLTHEKDLKYLYELHDSFKIFPTYACLMTDVFALYKACALYADFPKFDFFDIFLTQIHLEFYKDIKIDTEYETKAELIDFVEKKKNRGLYYFKTTVYEKNSNHKTPVAVQYTGLSFGKQGKIGAKSTFKFPSVAIPKRPPFKTVIEEVRPNQALINRPYKDYGPIHADPSMIRTLKYKNPSLQGFSVSGLVARLVVDSCFDGDFELMSNFGIKLISPAFTGEKYALNIWQEECMLIFELRNFDDKTLVAQGYVTEKKTVIRPNL